VYQLDFKNSTNRYTREDLLDNIKKVWDHNKRQPVINDMLNYPSSIHWGTYYNHFGSWKKALAEFVKYQNNGNIKQKEKAKIILSRRKLNKSLRYDIMKRDNFKCVLCGNSPALDHSVVLEVDHILPVKKGGTNKEDNLRTTCRNCNAGKIDK